MSHPVLVFYLGREKVEDEPRNFLGWCTAKKREKRDSPVLTHLGGVCGKDYSTHRDPFKFHILPIQEGVFAPVSLRITYFLGVAYFKLVSVFLGYMSKLC